MLLTVQDAAKRLGVKADLVYQLCSLRKLRHVRVGLGRGRIKIPEEAIAEYLAGATVHVDDGTPKPPPVRLKHLRVS